MPNPEEGSFYTPGAKSPSVQVGEEAKQGFRLTRDAEVLYRVQAIERVLLRLPVVCGWYAEELKRAGLERLNVK